MKKVLATGIIAGLLSLGACEMNGNKGTGTESPEGGNEQEEREYQGEEEDRNGERKDQLENDTLMPREELDLQKDTPR